MTEQEKALEEVESFKWMTSKGYDRKASKDIAQILVKYKEEQLNIHSVSDTLIAWQQFRDANWYESDSIDVDKMLMDKFQAIYVR